VRGSGRASDGSHSQADASLEPESIDDLRAQAADLIRRINELNPTADEDANTRENTAE